MERPSAAPGPELSSGDGRTCPWCGSRDTERIGEWGPQLLTEQWHCRACRTPFERIRRDPLKGRPLRSVAMPATMKHEDLNGVYCSVARTWAVLGERWTMMVIREAFRGTRRFDAFHERLHVGRNILSNRLQRLTAEGVFERALYHESPARYEYRLTQKGMDLYPVLLALMAWGDRYKVTEPPVRLVHKACGEAADLELTCSHCGEPVDYHSLRAEYAPNAW